jgi:hypothetical protein
MATAGPPPQNGTRESVKMLAQYVVEASLNSMLHLTLQNLVKGLIILGVYNCSRSNLVGELNRFPEVPAVMRLFFIGFRNLWYPHGHPLFVSTPSTL